MVSLGVRNVNLTLPYGESTTGRDVAEQIKTTFPSVDFSEHGLVFAFSVWLEEDRKLMTECGFEGEEILEFKMNPWMLAIKDTTSGKETKMKFDPSTACAEAVVNLMEKFKVKTEEDYGLFARNNEDAEKGEWLADTKHLSVYKSLKDKVVL